MRVSKILTPIALTAFIMIVLGIISFFTATNWVFLTIKGPWIPLETTVMPKETVCTELEGIICKLTNYSIRPVNYGTIFSIEKWLEDRWETVPVPKGFSFTLDIALIPPFSSIELYYPTGWFTQSSGDGLYRIKQNVWVGGSLNATEHPLYCKFTVK